MPGASAVPQEKPEISPRQQANEDIRLEFDPLDSDPKHLSTESFRRALEADSDELEIRTEEAIYRDVMRRIEE